LNLLVTFNPLYKILTPSSHFLIEGLVGPIQLV